MSLFSGKTVLVTGSTGLLGSHLVNRFMEFGDVEVVALGRDRSRLDRAFGRYNGNPNYTPICQEICNPLDIPTGRSIDYLFHAAGPHEPAVIADTPMAVIEPNLTGTINCLDFLRRQKETGHRGKFILFSSVTVYGNHLDRDRTVSERDTNVTDALDAEKACYSQSKRMSEVIALAYHKQYHQEVVVARLSSVYGCAVFPPRTAFYEFMQKAAGGEDIVVNSPGLGRRDNIYVEDAVDGLLRLALDGCSGEAYNVSSNGALGNYAAVDEIAQYATEIANSMTGKAARVSYKDGESSLRKPGLRLDNSKLMALGWGVRVSIQQGIRETLKGFLLTS